MHHFRFNSWSQELLPTTSVSQVFSIIFEKFPLSLQHSQYYNCIHSCILFTPEPAAPQNLLIKDAAGIQGNVVAQWDPLPTYKWGGVLKSYKVNYWKVNFENKKGLFFIINILKLLKIFLNMT